MEKLLEVAVIVAAGIILGVGAFVIRYIVNGIKRADKHRANMQTFCRDVRRDLTRTDIEGRYRHMRSEAMGDFLIGLAPTSPMADKLLKAFTSASNERERALDDLARREEEEENKADDNHNSSTASGDS